MIFLLRSLARVASLPTGNDSTVYGAARTSPQGFFLHHITAISSAIAEAESATVLSHAATRNFLLTLAARA